jgi:hypothetical protein
MNTRGKEPAKHTYPKGPKSRPPGTGKPHKPQPGVKATSSVSGK